MPPFVPLGSLRWLSRKLLVEVMAYLFIYLCSPKLHWVSVLCHELFRLAVSNQMVAPTPAPTSTTTVSTQVTSACRLLQCFFFSCLCWFCPFEHPQFSLWHVNLPWTAERGMTLQWIDSVPTLPASLFLSLFCATTCHQQFLRGAASAQTVQLKLIWNLGVTFFFLLLFVLLHGCLLWWPSMCT